jgi:hypothetical protein
MSKSRVTVLAKALGRRVFFCSRSSRHTGASPLRRQTTEPGRFQSMEVAT